MSIKSKLFKGFTGCKNGDCIIHDVKGMMTNGSCSCLHNLSRSQLHIEDCYQVMDECVIQGVNFYKTGASFAISSSIPTIVEDSIFVEENISDDFEMLYFYRCTFFGCSAMPPPNKMNSCKIINKMSVPKSIKEEK